MYSLLDVLNLDVEQDNHPKWHSLSICLHFLLATGYNDCPCEQRHSTQFVFHKHVRDPVAIDEAIEPLQPNHIEQIYQ